MERTMFLPDLNCISLCLPRTTTTTPGSVTRQASQGCGNCRENRQYQNREKRHFHLSRTPSRWGRKHEFHFEHIMLILVVVLQCFLIPVTTGMLCDRCDTTKCTLPIPGECEGGLSLDPCGCCSICAKVVNETCGGQYNMYGTCDEGLVCSIDPQLGTHITEHHTGICVLPGPLPTCDQSKCATYETHCPNDSVALVPTPNPRECCSQPPVCTCQPCTQLDLNCAQGQIKVTQVKGTGLPRSCCDIFECVDKDVYCMNVTCDRGEERYDAPASGLILFDDDVEEEGESGEVGVDICPPDSLPLPPLHTKEGCCLTRPGCGCKPIGECLIPECTDGLQLRILAPATRHPGFCCNHYTCVNASATGCSHEGVDHDDGATWQADSCITCKCRLGITFCAAMNCEQPRDCGWMSTPEGECCPVCRGCVSSDGGHFPSGATWQEENNCLTCRCEEGRVQCQAQLCSIQCSHPRKVSGLCCPVCDDTVSFVTMPPHCPVLDNCSLLCPVGLQRDKQGCYICRCQPEEFDCDLSCDDGFKYDLEGRKICECADLYKPNCPSMASCLKNCVYGYKVNKHGCPRCRCKKCPNFLCKKKCAHGYLENDKGCKICKCRGHDDISTTTAQTVVTPAGTRHGCMSVDGHKMEDGESWYDGCRRCFCYEGHEMCALITCPVPQCHNPVIKHGDCCPTCGVDAIPLTPGMPTRCHSSDGKPHAEGETWALDECTRCICHDGGVLCEIESCPPILCHHPVKLPNTCCPVCQDGSEFFPLPPVKEKKLCLSPSGMRFSDGDSWRVSACQSCVCRAGQIHCFSQTCPLLTCNKTMLKKGQCCPYCLDETPPVVCIHRGVEYSLGERWMSEDCSRCTCDHGHTVCTSVVCPTMAACPQPITLPNTCCPLCANDTGDIVSTVGTQGAAPSSTATPGDDDDDQGPDEGMTDPHHVTIQVLVTLVVLLSLAVIILVLLLLASRRKAYVHHNHHPTPVKMTPDPILLSEVKMRPKSTNIELQGSSPLPPEALKLLNGPKPNQLDLNKDIFMENEGKTYKTGEKILPQSESKLPIEEQMVKLLLDVPGIMDPNNFRNSV